MVESVFCKYFWKNKKIEKDTEKFQKLKDEYKKIREILNLLHESGQITLYEKQTLISMIKKGMKHYLKNLVNMLSILDSTNMDMMLFL